jgi:alanine racemase
MIDQDEFPSDADPFDIAPVRLTVDLGALAENWRDMARQSGSARTAAVVKADAYGLGLEDCGATLYEGRRPRFLRRGRAGRCDAARLCARCAHLRTLRHLARLRSGCSSRFDLVPVIVSEEQLAVFMVVP